jgi:amino acid transporter
MSSIFGFIIIAVLVFLSAIEIARWRVAQRGDEELPYPRRRLVRRMAISAIFIAAAAITLFWPSGSPLLQLLLLLAILAAVLVGLVLIWLELRETSLAALDEARTINQRAAHDLAELIKKSASKTETRENRTTKPDTNAMDEP